MLVLILFCISVCAYVILALRERIKEAYEQILPPIHPGDLPVSGHAHYLVSDTKFLWCLIQKISRDCTKLGGVSYGKFGSDIYYLITDPEDALTVGNTCLQKHFIYEFGKKWIGQGLVTGSGEVYKRHRKLLHPGYSTSVVHGYLDVFNTQARKLVSGMDAHSGKGPFNYSLLIRDMALETTCLTTFGFGITDKDFLHNYMNAVDKMLHIMMQRFQKFYLQSDLLYKLIGLQKREDQIIQTLNKMSNEVIQQKKAALKKECNIRSNEEVPSKPYLDLLIELSMKGLLTDKEIREEADTNIVAAYETTSNTLASIAILLGSNPKVQEKLYEELIRVLGTDRDVEKDDLPKLVYTKAVIKESLRVIPTVPAVLRFVHKEVELKKYTLRANSQCVILHAGMHCNPVWGPDAEQFKPERWLDPATLPANANHFAAFGIGRRSCAGRTYAMVLLSVVLAHLVRQYQLTADVTKLEMKLDFTLKAASGQEISIQRRKREMTC